MCRVCHISHNKATARNMAPRGEAKKPALRRRALESQQRRGVQNEQSDDTTTYDAWTRSRASGAAIGAEASEAHSEHDGVAGRPGAVDGDRGVPDASGLPVPAPTHALAWYRRSPQEDLGSSPLLYFLVTGTVTSGRRFSCRVVL